MPVDAEDDFGHVMVAHLEKMENSTSLFNKVVYVCSVRGTEALTFTTVHFIKAARRCLSLANVKPHHALTA